MTRGVIQLNSAPCIYSMLERIGWPCKSVLFNRVSVVDVNLFYHITCGVNLFDTEKL